jgi:hypothetical protein
MIASPSSSSHRNYNFEAWRYGPAENGLPRLYFFRRAMQFSAASVSRANQDAEGDGAFWCANVVHRTQAPKIQFRLYCEMLERRLTSARIEFEESYAGALY